ncbi:hypothetical protein K6119_14675 [Paracrocinitomix mangrovi]|uniref:DUF6985 domain-containing protein n=1 Tax=Paracrocinitomix mangrovi TaxID=2862509 RepID=UPI001EDA3135|nr:hypothetical protein [Paracrocinitomix mangrovi]UKN00977.1 hypothetical protein K6119_14675 [Paracrocinitomix mangrovi]
MKSIVSAVVGELNQDERIQNWYRGQSIQIPLVEKELPVTFMEVNEDDTTFVEEADEALKNFLALESGYKIMTAQAVFGNFVDYCSYISENDIPEKMKGTQPLNVWNFVYPTEVFVSRRAVNDKDIYVILACECEWEKEHGLQLVFRQGKKLTRVSDQDGHLTSADAFDIPDEEDEMLASF